MRLEEQLGRRLQERERREPDIQDVDWWELVDMVVEMDVDVGVWMDPRARVASRKRFGNCFGKFAPRKRRLTEG